MNIWQFNYSIDYEGFKPKDKKDNQFFLDNFTGKEINNYNKVLEIIPDLFCWHLGSIRSKRGELADFTVTRFGTIMFENAMNKLKGKLRNNVQFIELNHFTRGKCYALNVLKTINIQDYINIEKYEKFIPKFKYKDTYILKENMNYPYIFKLKENNSIYVTDEFINDMKKHNLTGISFILVGSSEDNMIELLKNNLFVEHKDFIYREYIDAFLDNGTEENYMNLIEEHVAKNYLKYNKNFPQYIEKYSNVYKQLIEYLQDEEVIFEYGYFGGKVKKEKIDIAEKYLKYNLPKSFKWWLRIIGGTNGEGCDEILTIVYDKYDKLDIHNSSDIIHLNNYYRYCDKLLSNNELIFCIGSWYMNNGFFYFDISSINEYGEYLVYFFNLDDKTKEFVAKDFLDFINIRCGFYDYDD